MKFLTMLLLLTWHSFAQDYEKLVQINFNDLNQDSYSFKAMVFPMKGMVASSQPNTPQVALHMKPIPKPKNPDIIWDIDVQAGTITITSNNTQIPSSTGTLIDLDESTIFNYRVYLNAMIKNKHQIRLLYAPLQYEGAEFIPNDDILFDGITFLAGVPTKANYKFNSYRLSYMYHFNQRGKVRFRIGLSAKIRDAFTAVEQTNGLKSKFSNLGFVPLFHVGAQFFLNTKSFLDFDNEGSWAPQGYAIDSRLSYNYRLNNRVNIGAGVGFLSGGADVASVKTFTTALYGFGRVQIYLKRR